MLQARIHPLTGAGQQLGVPDHAQGASQPPHLPPSLNGTPGVDTPGLRVGIWRLMAFWDL